MFSQVDLLSWLQHMQLIWTSLRSLKWSTWGIHFFLQICHKSRECLWRTYSKGSQCWIALQLQAEIAEKPPRLGLMSAFRSLSLRRTSKDWAADDFYQKFNPHICLKNLWRTPNCGNWLLCYSTLGAEELENCDFVLKLSFCRPMYCWWKCSAKLWLRVPFWSKYATKYIHRC